MSVAQAWFITSVSAKGRKEPEVSEYRIRTVLEG